MAEQERNFRTHYYEKVGFRAIEEKKSIEILLKEPVIRKDKLIQFCLRFGVPAMYRIYVWKILLGVLPVSCCCQDYVWKHRQKQVVELENAVNLLAPDTIDGTTESKVLRMKLIKDGTLPVHNRFVHKDPNHQYFQSVVKAVGGLVSSFPELFWISFKFYKHISESFYGSLSQFPEYTMICLKKEDQGQRLYQHLSDHQVMASLPLDEWFHTCFANILPDTSLERIWDRVIGGSSQVLVYVAVSILLILRRPLLSMQTSKQMVSYLKQIPEDCGDRIVNEALDLLHKNGGQLPAKPDSPLSESGRSSAKSLTDSGRHSGNLKPATAKSRHGSMDSSFTSEKAVQRLMENKSVTVEIARKSPGTGPNEKPAKD